MRKRLYLLLLIFPFLFFGCKKDKTSWDSKYKILLVNDTLKLNNISKDSLFASDSDGNLMLSLEKDLFAFNVFQKVSIPDTLIKQKYALGVNNFEATPGFNLIDQVDDHLFDLGEAKLTYVKVRSGVIRLEVGNIFPTKVKLVVSLPKVSKNGDFIQKTLNIDAGSKTSPTVKSVDVDISGYTIDLKGKSNDSYNKLTSSIRLTTDVNGPTVNVTKFDSTAFTINFKDIKLSGARGYFGQISSSESFQQKIDFFNKLSGVFELGAYNFDLILKNSCKVEGELKIKELKNENENTNQSVSLQHEIINQSIFVQSATGNWENLTPYQRIFNFNSNNSNVGNLFSNLGSIFSGGIDFKLNPNGDNNPGWNELFSDSKLAVTMKANMPLKIGMKDLMFKDTFAFKIKNQLDKTHLKQGVLILDVSNAYPIDMLATIEFLDEEGDVIGVVSSSDRVLPSTEGDETKNGVKYAHSIVKLDIDEEISSQLSMVTHLVVKLKANTYSSTNSFVTHIPYNGFIGFKLYGDFGINIKL